MAVTTLEAELKASLVLDKGTGNPASPGVQRPQYLIIQVSW